MTDHPKADPGGAPPTEALTRVARKSQELVLRKLDVLRLEIEHRIDQVEARIAASLGAAFLLATAWLLLCAAAVFAVRSWVGSFAPALALVGIANAMTGFVVLRAPGRSQ